MALFNLSSGVIPGVWKPFSRTLLRNKMLYENKPLEVLYGTRTASDLPQKPKRPAPAFARFVKMSYPKIKQESPELSSTDMMKIAQGLWKQLDKKTKEKFTNEAKEMYDEYKKERDEYEAGLSVQEAKTLKAKSQSKLLEKKVKMLGPPKKPPSAYSLYLKAKLSQKSNLPSNERMKLVAEEWKQLDEKEKKKYKDEALKVRAKYDEDLVQWSENFTERMEPKKNQQKSTGGKKK